MFRIIRRPDEYTLVWTLVADDLSDMDKWGTEYGQGSSCFVISTKETYMLNGSKAWVLV